MATLNQRLEQIIINLKVISKLEIGQRLLFKTKSVSIRNHYMIITPLIRLAANESRDDVTKGLSELVEDVNRLVVDYQNSSELQNPNASEYDRNSALSVLMSLNRLKIGLPPVIEHSNKGLNAAKETYSNDPETSAKIEGIIDNLKLSIRNITIVISDMSKKYGLEGKMNGLQETSKHFSTKDNDEKIKIYKTDQILENDDMDENPSDN